MLCLQENGNGGCYMMSTVCPLTVVVVALSTTTIQFCYQRPTVASLQGMPVTFSWRFRLVAHFWWVIWPLHRTLLPCDWLPTSGGLYGHYLEHCFPVIGCLFWTISLFPGSAITGPVAKECADLWPRIASNASSIA